MQRAIRYLIDSYGLSSVDDLYTCLKDEIKSGPEGAKPLYVELKDLKICPGDSPLCLSRHCELANSSSNNMNLRVDELDLINLLERRRTRKRDYNLVRVLCRFNKCCPIPTDEATTETTD
ncbi:hypothetical protein niasHT_024922 [Heterodera trifolii]|uniref:Uncharacterized protein n=1 Tax=Heterodera trifolii TaxID=157864 RepID=A0ABD2KQ89_9BILA